MAPFASQKRDGLVLVNPLRTSNHHIRDSAGKVVGGRRANRKLTHQFHVPRGDSCRVQSFPRAIVPANAGSLSAAWQWNDMRPYW